MGKNKQSHPGGFARLLDMKAYSFPRPIVLWIPVERPYGVGEWGVDDRTHCGHRITPATCAIYARQNELLEDDRLNQFKKIANHE